MLIDFKYIFKKYNVHATGVLHIGAHYGQEVPAYWTEGIRDIVLIEAFRPTWKQLCRNMLPYTGVISINACISDADGHIVPFGVSSNEGQSSSMLEFDTHSREHPTVVMQSHTRLQTATVRTVLKDRNLDPALYNFINIDIQGAELMALKGMDLSCVDYAYIEVNEKHLYKDCPLVDEIDAYLLQYGLHRVETKMTNHGWGDAFYIRKQSDSVVNVPSQFKPVHPFPYPGDNNQDFERWYMMNHKPHDGRIYLPVMWTAYYCGKKVDKESLQRFLNGLDKSLKYYTIVQYDDGILNHLAGIDIKVFSMSGPGDYHLPLICEPHKEPPAQHRDIFASFVGRRTHPIRNEILRLNHPCWQVTDKVQPMSKYCNTISRSIFTLCPRGYGPTSFRIAEAMQYGSIPVYVSDVFIEPHGIDFNEYGVKIRPGEDIKEILSFIDVQALQESIAHYYPRYFTYEANKKIIDDIARTV
jgi:FkbM family methyltransferase